MECLLLSKLLVEINAPLYSSRLSDDKNERRTGDMQGAPFPSRGLPRAAIN